MLTFSHSGGIGDILYSLYFCRDVATAAKQEKFNFHIQINVIDPNMNAQKHPFGCVRMTQEAAEFLKPLLEAQPYINEVSIDDKVPEKAINLDKFRTLRINFASGDIRNWYYNLSQQHLPREFWKPVLEAEAMDEKYKDKILFVSTARYQNIMIDYKLLVKYKDSLLFMGTKTEYEDFVRKYFNMEYCPITSMYDAARVMVSAKGVVGNESGLYSIAECLKVPRILIAPELFVYNNNVVPGPHNVHPQGNWCEDVSTNDKLLASIDELLKK